MPKRAAKKKAVATKAARTAPKKAAKKAAPKRARRAASSATRATRAAIPPAAERAVDHDLVDRTVDMLQRHDDAALESELAIGAHVFDQYFGGDEVAVRSNDPRKPQSYRLLAERAEAETTWEEPELRRAVLRLIVYRSLAVSVAKQIPASLLYELGKLEDVDKRREIAGAIATRGLAGIEAREAIAEANAGERRGGRPAAPAIVKLANRVEREWARAREDGGLTARRMASLDGETRSAVRARLVRLRAELEALLERLDAP